MARGACVPWASSGARPRAGRLGAALGALGLLSALVLLVRLGAPGARPAASAAQVSPSLRPTRVRESPVPGGRGPAPAPSSPAATRLVGGNLPFLAVRATLARLG